VEDADANANSKKKTFPGTFHGMLNNKMVRIKVIRLVGGVMMIIIVMKNENEVNL